MRILISGFEPFGGDAVNPTSKFALDLAGDLQLQIEARKDDKNGGLRGVVLPVLFEDAFARLHHEIAQFDPHAIISLGLAGGRAFIEPERVAINCMDSEVGDNGGRFARNEPVMAAGAPAYFSTLPLAKLCEAAREADVPSRISNSAGTFVCNDLFYRLQQLTQFSRRRSGFVHVPFLPEQAARHSGAASMPYDQQRRGLAAMLRVLLLS